jgi:hypothetical protein
VSDSSGKSVHSAIGKTDNGTFSYSWVVDRESPSYYSVTVMTKSSSYPNWLSGTLYFNRTPAQMDSVEICTYTDPEGKFTLDYPEGWSALPKESTSSILDVTLTNHPSGSGVVTMSIDNSDSSNHSVEDLVAIDMDSTKGNSKNFRLLNGPVYVDYNVSGHKTGTYTYTHDLSGEQKTVLKLGTKFNDRFLILSYIANQNDFDSYLPSIEKIIRPIQLKT